MVLRRLDCLRCECNGKQSKEMLVRLFGMVLRFFGQQSRHLVLRLLAMVLRLVAAEFTAPLPSQYKYEFSGQQSKHFVLRLLAMVLTLVAA
jgi:uncharacterized membrane protein